MSAIGQAIEHTPIWVFPMFLLVVWLGILALKTRVVPFPALAALPLVALILGGQRLVAVATAQPMALAAWAGGMLVGAAAGHASNAGTVVRPLAGTLKLEISGTRWTLALILGIFVFRYVFGYLYGRWPELAVDALLVMVEAGGGALFGGLFLGRLVATWRAYRAALPRG